MSISSGARAVWRNYTALELLCGRKDDFGDRMIPSSAVLPRFSRYSESDQVDDGRCKTGGSEVL